MITMCEGFDCPKKHSCGRYLEKVGKDDFIFFKPPYNETIKDCEFYMGIEEGALREYIKDILKVPDKSNGHAGTEV
jgi:16S rRNA G966 N2-methylase RsmD